MPSVTASMTAAAFCVGIGVPCVIGLASTPAPTPGAGALSGSFQRGYEENFADSFPMSQTARAAYTALTLAAFNEAGPEVLIGADEWLFTAEEFRDPDEDEAFISTFSMVRYDLARHGITLIPVIVPDKARVYSDHLPAVRPARFAPRYDTILDSLARRAVPVADLASLLQDARADGPTFMRTDTHWSPRGARLAADAVATAAGLHGQGAQQFLTDTGAATMLDGDLMPFVETGPFSAWVGITPETISIPVTYGAASDADLTLDLFGESQTDIVLVGTSFSARPEFNFAGALQAATGMSVVNLSVEGRGPFAPMQDALGSGAITDLSPAIVIWEIPERYIQPRTYP